MLVVTSYEDDEGQRRTSLNAECTPTSGPSVAEVMAVKAASPLLVVMHAAGAVRQVPPTDERRPGRERSKLELERATWLILPVVICFSQWLSHASASAHC
ncbi:hypothetical protein M514_11049 [Trichuris suis]|uniref:Uncharacterized protein n=1 Tax=Trichuris suis TaxID=68888 RepID=A0A085MW83_9BILA|nr:hypothetical protein M514_11049 [Trichuris suis]